MHFENADVRTVLQLLAAYRDYGILSPPDLTGQVDVDLDGTSDAVIQRLLDSVGRYRLERDDAAQLMRVVPVEGPR